jgi:hypothetical protein
MKSGYKISMMVCALLLAVSAFAANKNSVDLTLNHPAVVNGTTLKAGEYKVMLDRNGDRVQATFLSSGKTVATSSGHFEQRSSFAGPVSVVVKDGDRAIQQIVVQKLKGAVVLDDGTPSATGH